MENLIGQTLGQYRIVEQIGQGGMATVYKAYQPSLDRYVAIKVLPAYFAHEPGFSERFTREAHAVARLNHPNILPIYDFGQQGELSYIVMKYVDAGTLQGRLHGPLPLDVTARLIRQIALALDHAHERGILHRDVKPSNVLLDEGDWVLLTDFGLAKMVEGSAVLTASGVGVGTPAYMAPEQGRGAQVDERADIYSLGIVLYEMVTGRVPFQAETPMAVVIRHITDPLPLPRTINPALPEAVERVILKALAKDPADRFARAGELADALNAAVSDSAVLPIQVPVAGAPPPPVEPPAWHVTPLPTVRIEPTPAPQPVIQTALPKRRGFPWKIAVPLIVVLALVGVVGVLLTVFDLFPGGDRAALLAAATGTSTATATLPTSTPRSPTQTPKSPFPTATSTRKLPTQTPRATVTPTARPPTATPTLRPSTPTPKPPTATPTDVPLPGVETIPVSEMDKSIPWLPYDADTVPGVYYYGFNLSRPPFDNLLVRQAFALAIDRQALSQLAQSVGFSAARPATSFTPPQTLGRDLYGAVGLPYDPDRARRLLAEAGYPDGQGFPQVSLHYNDAERNQAIAGFVVAAWREILGVDVELVSYDDWNAYTGMLYTDAPPLFRLGWAADLNDPIDFLGRFISTTDLALSMHFSNAEYDRLIVNSSTAAAGEDPAFRQRLYIQAERLLCEQEAAVIPLFHSTYSSE